MKKILLIFTVFVLSLVMISCTNNDLMVGMKTVGSYNELKKIVGLGQYNGDIYPESGVDFDNAEKGNEQTSTTNVQVEGVDEGDIVKVDNNRIYQIYGNHLVVTSISGDMEVLLNVTLESEKYNSYYSDLYLTDDFLVVIGNSYSFHYYENDSESIMPRFDYYQQNVVVLIYEIETLTKVKSIEISGYLNTSRLIEDRLYIFSTKYINLYNDEIDPRPYYMVDGDLITPAYSDIYYHPDLSKDVFNQITTITLKDDVDLNYQTFLGSYSYGTIYVSLNSIYFTSYQYLFDSFANTYKSNNTIFSFDFVDSGVAFAGYGTYKGYIINQFSVDEYDGYLRLVTTDGFGDSVINRLYVYKKLNIDGERSLERVSLLEEGIGKPRERIYSARFNKTKLTVVTFEQIDPFYLIDLTDPFNPVILAELEVPGFSLYQHNWNETVVLGIGYETKDAISIGLKLSMYDISDETSLSEIGSPLVLYNEKNGFTYGEALYNHKAILFDIPRSYFGFSISKTYFRNYQYNNVNEYVIFGVDLESETPIEIKKVISHNDYYEPNENEYYYYMPYSIQRAVYVGNYLYAISNGAITKHDINNEFTQMDVITFGLNN